MVNTLLYILFLFAFLSCSGNEANFEPNNLISISEDDTANAKANGDAKVLEITILDGDYSYLEPLYVDVKFSQFIWVNSGVPRIALDVGGATVYANYLSGSGTNTLRFQYLPLIGETDNDGIQAVTPWELNGADLKDTIGQNPQLAFTSKYFPNVIVDTAPPSTTFNALPSINYHNQNAYSISGTCTDKSQRLDIFIGSFSLSSTCSASGTFSFSVNLTSVTESAVNTIADVNIYTEHYDYAGNKTTSASTFVIKDTIRPYVTSNTTSSTGMNIVADPLDFSVNFNENIYGAGTKLKLNFSDSEKTPGSTFATYQSGTTTNSYTYQYTIPPGYIGNGDEDTNGIVLSSTIDLDGTGIVDYNGNQLVTTLATTSFPTTLVDGIKPLVTSVTTPTPSYSTYYINQTMPITVVFDDTVYNSGSPRLALDTFNVSWGGAIYMDYVSGSGSVSKSLVFNETFVNGYQDNNGLTINANIQNSNDLKDINGNTIYAALSTNSFPGIYVDALTPTLTANVTPTINIANRLSYNLSGSCSEYLHSETVDVVATDRLSGSLNFNIPCSGGSYNQNVDLSSLSDSVNPTTADFNFTFNHSDRGGNSATQITRTVRKDTVAPTVSSNNTSHAAQTRICGEDVRFNVNFSEVVEGATSSRLLLTFSNSEKTPGSTYAAYNTGNSTTQYRYIYSIPNGYIGNGDEDTDGVDHASSIDLQGGAIADVNGNPLASNTLSTTNFATLLVDGIKPLITNVTTPTPSYSTYYINQTMPITVVFDDVVYNSGTPRLALDTFNVSWGGAIYMDYVSGSGSVSKSLVFNETFVNGYQDNNGLTINANIQNSNDLKDINGNTIYAALSTNSFPGIYVDALTPTLTANVTPTINIANKLSYNLSGSCSEYLHSETVDVVATDRLAGSLTFNIPCSGGSYNQNVDLSSLSDSVNPTTADFNFTFNHSDRGGNSATQITRTVRKDTVAPTLSSNTLQTLNDIYIIGETINILVNYTEIVSSTGGTIDLNFETETATAPVAAWNAVSNNTNQHSYQYTIIQNEEDTNGIILTAAISGATITDVNGNPTSGLTLTSTSFANATVDGIIPVVNIDAVGTVNNANKNSYTVTGSCTSGDLTVNYTFASPAGGSNVTGSVACSGGTWTTGAISLVSLNDHTAITFNADQFDLGGNQGFATQLSALKDTVDPVLSISTPAIANSYNYTGYTFGGSCTTSDGNVSYTIVSPSGGSNVTGSVACSGGSWSSGSINLISLNDDPALTFNAQQTDAGTNTGYASQQTEMKDIVLPVLSINAVSTINNTNKNSYSISGSCTTGDGNVTYTLASPSGGSDATASVACLAGSWTSGSIVVTSPNDNLAVTFDAEQTDTAGNIGDATQLNTIKDTADPNVAINAVISVNASNYTSYTVTGTCETGDGNVSYTFSSPSGGTDVTGSVSCSAGTWTTTAISMASLNDDAAITFNALQTDSNANTGNALQLTAIKNIVLPIVTISAVATINNANFTSYTVTGTCTTGDGNVSYTFASPSGGTDVTGSVSCSAGTWTTTAISMASLNDDAAISFNANQTDTALNTGVATQLTALKDAVVPVVAINAVSTISNANYTAYTVSGTCTTGDGNVSYTFASPSGGTDVTGSVSCSASSWTTGAITMASLNDDAAITFNANQTDIALNTTNATQLTALKDIVLPSVAINAVSTINNINFASYTVTGTCTTGDGNVSYTFASPSGGTDVTGSVSCSAGTWTTTAISMASLNDDAAISFNANQTDTALNTGVATQLTAIKDSVVPVVALNAVSTINNSNKTNYTVTGTCTTGDGNVSYTFASPSGGTDVTGSVICNIGGVWTTGTINLTGLNDDLVITFDAQQTDTNSNTGNAIQLTAIKDTNNPVIAINSTSTVNAGNYTLYSVSGTCTSGDGNISYTFASPSGGTDVTGSVACNTNTWTTGSISLAALNDDAAITFDAFQIDSNSNTGNATQLSALKDIVLPSVTINAVSTISNANDTAYTVTGTCTTGDGNISYTFASPSGGTDVTGSVSCSASSWTTGAISMASLNDDAAISFNANQTDTALNTGVATQLTALKDAVVPVVAINAVSTINNANYTAYTVTGTCTTGDGNVSYTFASPSGGTDVTGSVSCSASSWTTGAITMASLNDDAAITFNANQTDIALNTTNATQLTTLKDIVLPSVAINAVSTINNANDTAYTVTGTCTTGDGNVSYTFASPSGGTDVTGSVSCSAGTWTTGAKDLTTVNDNAAITFDASQTDTASNTGNATQLTAIKDTANPVVAINAVSTVNKANYTAYTVTGTCTTSDGNVSYTISSPSGGTDVTGSVVCSAGTWTTGTKNLTTVNDNAAITFDASQTDSNSNTGNATQRTALKDTSAPVVAIDAVSTVNNSNYTAYTVTGTCTNGDGNISYTISSPSGGTDVTGSTSCSAGTWTTGAKNLTSVNDNAAITFDAAQTDSASNTTSATQKTALKDTSAPVVAIDAVSTINVANYTAYTLTGTCSTGDGNVSYTIASPSGGTDVTGSVSCSAGTWTTGAKDLTTVNDNAAITFDAAQTDSASNTTSATQKTALKDTSAPVVAINAVSTVNNSNYTAYTVTGTCTTGDGNVSYTFASPSGGTDVTGSVSCSASSWTTTAISMASLNDDAAITFNANQTDTALNTGVATQLTAIKDAVVPVVAINAVSTINNANYAAYTVTGTCTTGDGNVSYTFSSPSGGTDVTGSVTCSTGSWTTTAISMASLNDDAAISFNANQTDSGSNTTNATQLTALKDIVLPTVAINAVSTINNANYTAFTVTGTCTTGDGNVSYTFASPSGGTDVTGSVSCSAGTWTTTAISMASLNDDAAITFNANQTDTALNTGVATQLTNTKDISLPTVAITAPANASIITSATDSSTFAVSGTCDESGQTVIIKIDGSIATSPAGFSCDGSNFSGTIDTTGLAYAVYSFTAELSDAVGNLGTSATNSVEKVNYLVSITTPVSISLANEISFSVSGTCSKNTEVVNVAVGGSVMDTPTCTAGSYTTASMDVSALSDSTVLSIIAVHGSASDSTTTIKDTSIPVITLATLANIAIANETTFPVTGNCSDNGENIDITIGAVSASGLCSAGAFSINVNTSSITDGNSISVLADHQDAIGNTATQVSTLTNKDTIAPTVSTTYSPNITAANEATYSISGSCSENSLTVNVDIDGLAFTPSCSGGSWSVGPTNISTRLDNSNLPITVNQTDSFGNTGNASSTVDKTTSVPTVAITSSPDINQANLTSYIVSGTCSENGTSVSVDVGGISKNPNCSSGTWSTSQIDATALSDGTVSITADHSTATQASTSISKDTSSATVTISSAQNITTGNELTYTASGTCSENGVSVDVYIDSLNYLVSCSVGTWTTGLIDVSSLSDGTSLLVTADHDTAIQDTKSINKDTATPTVSGLGVSSTLTQSIDITWNLNDPSGFSIDDYTINYRVKGSPTWLLFSDAVSTLKNSSITSLVASTTYEFRVRVEYDSGSSSAWSDSTEGETQPDSPLFGPYTAMNVGGSTTTTVVAYEDSTTITLNGGALTTLNKGQTHIFTSAQFDYIDADKPIFTAGRRGSGGNTAKGNIVWQPTAWAGKSFSFNATRETNQYLDVYAIEGTSIEIKQGSTVLASTTLTADATTTLSWTTQGSYQVTSTGSILAFHISGTATRIVDPKPLLPDSNEIIGFPSNYMKMTTGTDGTNYNGVHSNSVTESGSQNKSDVIRIDPQGGTTSLYQSESLLISADQKIFGSSYADANGNCAAPFLPTSFMKTKYAMPVNGDYIAFASKSPGTITVKDASDVTVTTLTLTRSGGTSNAPYKARLANPTAGHRYISTVPVGAWYQPNTDVGAADQDETIMYGTN